MGLSSQRQRCPGGCFLGSAGHQAILLPSMNSTTWFSRRAPLVNVVLKTSPTRWTRCPGAEEARLLLPSQLGWREGSAISSKIRSASAEITRVALTMRSGGSASMSLSKHVASPTLYVTLCQCVEDLWPSRPVGCAAIVVLPGQPGCLSEVHKPIFGPIWPSPPRPAGPIVTRRGSASGQAFYDWPLSSLAAPPPDPTGPL